MASQKQIDANRRNAQRSTGPNTPEGKAATKFNSLKHGMTAVTAVLPHEDADSYNELRESFLSTYKPANAVEASLVETIANSYWRLLRARRVETAALDMGIRGLKKRHNASLAPIKDDDQSLVVVLNDNEDPMLNVERHQTKIERCYFKAIETLRKVQNDRRREERLNPPPSWKEEEEIGFVLHRRTGKHAQGTICYTVSPLHTTSEFVDMAQKLLDLGCDSICIKDMAALLKPQPAYDIVKGIKEACGEDTRIHVHVHATTGVTLVSLMKAIEAGADCVDTAISSMSLGPGHNPTESLVEMLEGTGYHTELDAERLLRVKDHFDKVRPRYKEFLSNIIGVDTEIFKSQIPGGMISNMESQLKQQGAADRLKEVLAEVPNVRKDAGYPPLVTPSSQIVGTQAVFNVMMGRYKVLTGEFADLMLGYYGETIGPRDQHVVELAGAQAKKPPINDRPADHLKPEWEELRSAAIALKGCNGSDEDVLTYAMFPQVAPKFFGTRSRAEGPRQRPKRRKRLLPRRSRAGGLRTGRTRRPHRLQGGVQRQVAQSDSIARITGDDSNARHNDEDSREDRRTPRAQGEDEAGWRRRALGKAPQVRQADGAGAHRCFGGPGHVRRDRVVRAAPRDDVRNGRQRHGSRGCRHRGSGRWRSSGPLGEPGFHGSRRIGW
jgi:pyruvate/oxaloacetate carboxyltransferase